MDIDQFFICYEKNVARKWQTVNIKANREKIVKKKKGKNPDDIPLFALALLVENFS